MDAFPSWEIIGPEISGLIAYLLFALNMYDKFTRLSPVHQVAFRRWFIAQAVLGRHKPE